MDRSKWEYKKLSEVSDIIMGQSPSSDSYNEDGNGLPFYQGNADFGELYPTARVYCDAPSREADFDDVLMSVRAPIGAINIANEHCCIGRGLCAIRPIPNVLDKMYLFYFLRAKNAFLNLQGTGSTFKSISKKVVYDLIIPMPSYEYQQRIVAELDCLNEMISVKQEQLKEFDKLAQSIFYDMFGDPVSNEKGWELRKLESLCTHIVDCPHSTPKKVDVITAYPCIRTSELKGGEVQWGTMQYLDEQEYEIRIKRLRPLPGDIVFGREGTIGDAVILPEGYYFSLGQRTMLLRVDKKQILETFLHRTIMSEWVRRQIRMVNVSSTVAHVNIKDFKVFDIPVPPLSLQQKFAEKISAIEAQKEMVKQSIAETQALLYYTMDKYFG